MYTISIRNSYDLKNLDLVEWHGMLKTYVWEMSQDSKLLNNAKKAAEASTQGEEFDKSFQSKESTPINHTFMAHVLELPEHESILETLKGYAPFYPSYEQVNVGTSNLKSVKHLGVDCYYNPCRQRLVPKKRE
ncbi:hypothetical protein L1987_32862 [Smallanthus sonchifolius]|uniref:Uncharacterized protein n=1 Tax=Smallanthus sonchifolius TaxID=185202 RepID=A0ACB9HP68_9ASTR|nr:hypothetical protein L1987_32862 [Smallanthus sonchifolius]